MYIAKYLLSIEEFMDTDKGEALMERAFLYVDEERRGKAQGMRTGRARAAGLGAGLLLQLAVREAVAAVGRDALSGCDGEESMGYVQDMLSICDGEAREQESGVFQREGESDEVTGGAAADAERETEAGCGTACAAEKSFHMRRYGVSQLLEILQDKPTLPLAYRYGKGGKPYFRNMPFYFNLSHSGEYVLCVIAVEEVGADIQQHRFGKNRNPLKGDYVGRLAGRFFSERECAALERAGGEREKLFFRLWARKEAYGKLTGKGVAGVLDADMLSGEGEAGAPSGTEGVFGKMFRRKSIFWEEYDGVEGYSIAVCRYG